MFWTTGALLCALLPSQPALAEKHSPASVTIAETTRMDFGTIAIPFSGTQSLALSPANSNETGSGNRLFGIPSRGVYTLRSTGGEDASMTIDISSVQTNSPNLKLDEFTGIYNNRSVPSFPSAALSLPGRSGARLYVGARETVSAAMRPSAPNPTFDIVVIVN